MGFTAPTELLLLHKRPVAWFAALSEHAAFLVAALTRCLLLRSRLSLAPTIAEKVSQEVASPCAHLLSTEIFLAQVFTLAEGAPSDKRSLSWQLRLPSHLHPRYLRIYPPPQLSGSLLLPNHLELYFAETSSATPLPPPTSIISTITSPPPSTSNPGNYSPPLPDIEHFR